MPTLVEYKRKRHFDKTPEPPAKVASRTGKGLLYVVHKHDASRLHYDFRLEHNGVLLSWAIPKGPSPVAGDKRLAVQVEEHPLDYGSFEGTIPKDQYGGGTVMLWDQGEWLPQGDPETGLRRGTLEFQLKGHKLNGRWLLTRMSRSDAKDNTKENWLLIKKHDKYTRSRNDPDILDELSLSVTTHRSLEEIASNAQPKSPNAKPASTGNDKGRKDKARTVKTRTVKARTVKARKPKTRATHQRNISDPASLPGAQKASFPEWIRPQLATLTREAPEGNQWLHEIKFDGYRLMCFIQADRVRLVTRNGNDWTRKLSQLEKSCRTLGTDGLVLDGELVAITQGGLSDFQTLQNALKQGNQTLEFYAFDLPYFGGYDLSRCPLIERKRLLQEVIAAAPEGSTIHYSEHITGKGRIVYESAYQHGMEGIISKLADSRYEQKRSAGWLKVKCGHRQEFVIGGWTDPAGSRRGFGALLIGYYDATGKLVYAGRVGTGFNEALLHDLYQRMSKLSAESSPFANPPRGKTLHWIKPELVAEVSFSEWTREDILRHPSFQGIRTDKPARQITREAPLTISDMQSDITQTNIAGVVLSNPDRVLYPEQSISKQQLAEYYEAIADWILPHITDRPLAVLRCPRGHQHKCFFQKHITEGLPESIHSIAIRGHAETHQTLLIKDLAGLIGLVQLGCLEIHPWGSRADDVEKPDRITFDLDPGPDVAWGEIRDTAVLVRDFLDEFGLTSYVKTSGGKGLHVVVPIARRSDWDEVKTFAGAVAKTIAERNPGKYVTTMTKSKRQGKIFIDYLRNSRGATSIAAYSTRARHGAPVSTPLTWQELIEASHLEVCNIETLPVRLRGRSDPWKGFFDTRPPAITVAMKRNLNL